MKIKRGREPARPFKKKPPASNPAAALEQQLERLNAEIRGKEFTVGKMKERDKSLNFYQPRVSSLETALEELRAQRERVRKQMPKTGG